MFIFEPLPIYAIFLQPNSTNFSAASLPPSKLSLDIYVISFEKYLSILTNGIFSETYSSISLYVIAITYSDIDEYVSEKIPFVSIDRYFSKDITYISSDNFEGGRLAAEKLVEFGCRKIAYIGRGSKINNATRKRKDGFISYCKEHNINYEICEILGSSKEFDKLLNEFIANNFKEDIKIQGVFVVTDEQALDFIHKLEECNIDVPKDVQVIGFDGSKSSVNDIIKISTIRQPVELIAKEAVKSLINIIENNKVEKEIILPISFINGYTTKR